MPDETTVLNNIINSSKYTFANGDYARLYCIQGKIQDSFVFMKYNPTGNDVIGQSDIDNLKKHIEELEEKMKDIKPTFIGSGSAFWESI